MIRAYTSIRQMEHSFLLLFCEYTLAWVQVVYSVYWHHQFHTYFSLRASGLFSSYALGVQYTRSQLLPYATVEFSISLLSPVFWGALWLYTHTRVCDFVWSALCFPCGTTVWMDVMSWFYNCTSLPWQQRASAGVIYKIPCKERAVSQQDVLVVNCS